MARKKEKTGEFLNLIQNKKVPILTLDERWHALFPEHEKTIQIKLLEKKLNNLLKNQGKKVNDIKDLRKLKTKLIKDIVSNMDESESELSNMKSRRQHKDQKRIVEINAILNQSEEDLIHLPYKIKEANQELLAESMKVCYEKMKYNKVEIAKAVIWVAKVREELKNRLLKKQDMEMKNEAIYTYMHDLVGAELIEIFDNKM